MNDHTPHRTGGPAFAVVCAIDDEPWPCTAAAADDVTAASGATVGKGKSATPAPGTFDDSQAGATTTGTTPHAETHPGELPEWATRPDADAAESEPEP